jgi:hypothetical protein
VKVTHGQHPRGVPGVARPVRAWAIKRGRKLACNELGRPYLFALHRFAKGYAEGNPDCEVVRVRVEEVSR